jgi:hypothetical protein
LTATVQPPLLRPATTADLLDGGVAFLKSCPRAAIGITAAFIVPLQLLIAWLQRDVLGGGGFTDALSDPTGSSLFADDQDAGLEMLLALVAPSVVLAFVSGAFVLMMLAEQDGRELTPGAALAGAARRSLALVVAWMLVHLLEAVAALALVLPALAVMTVYLVTSPAIVAEGLGPVAGMRRSWRLCRRRFWSVFGVAVLSGLVASAIEWVLGLLPTILADELGGTIGWLLLAVGQSLASLVAIPVVAATTALVYLDLRLRLEGLDLELDAARAFPAGADAR